jgi:Flp pilus assembly CpaE family ATPase
VNAAAVVATVLSSLGALCELAGLVLVVREIRSDRERGRRLLESLEQPARPNRTYPAPMRPALGAPLTGADMERTGDTFRRLEAGVANALLKLKRTTDAELDQAIEQVQRDVAERDAELRDGLRYVLAGSTRDRWTGVVLLGVGVILSGVGSVVGNLT